MIILILAVTERCLADPVAVMCSTTAKCSLHLSALLLKSIAIFLFAPYLSALLCHLINGSVSKTLRGKKLQPSLLQSWEDLRSWIEIQLPIDDSIIAWLRHWPRGSTQGADAFSAVSPWALQPMWASVGSPRTEPITCADINPTFPDLRYLFSPHQHRQKCNGLFIDLPPSLFSQSFSR